MLLRFSINVSLPVHYGPRVNSAHNRNEYQESSLGVMDSRRIRLTTSLSFVSQLLRKSKSLDVSQPYGLLRHYKDRFTLGGEVHP
jgi:hypothetical protein